MMTKLNIAQELSSLLKDPEKSKEGEINGYPYRAKIGITHYDDHIQKQYEGIVGSSLNNFCQKVSIPFHRNNFGLIIEFKKQASLQIHDLNMMMNNEFQEIVQMFGPLIMRNIILDDIGEENEHKAIFSDLNFHRDRGFGLPRQYSLYYRSPNDPDHALPRKSSTVFITNIVAYLQYLQEHDHKYKMNLDNHYNLFKPLYQITDASLRLLKEKLPADLISKISSLKDHEALHKMEFLNNLGKSIRMSDMEKYSSVLLKSFTSKDEKIAPLIGKIILEQDWSAPKNNGEIVIIDNQEIFHASHYRNGRGYRIRVRYLYP
ncbi:MAG: hypothetical protein COA79_01505 [Planctomycetota bacterium]|nr:MAG: hypothetical protein COA79_01505 [Planctomycetota bacterium]